MLRLVVPLGLGQVDEEVRWCMLAVGRLRYFLPPVNAHLFSPKRNVISCHDPRYTRADP